MIAWSTNLLAGDDDALGGEAGPGDRAHRAPVLGVAVLVGALDVDDADIGVGRRDHRDVLAGERALDHPELFVAHEVADLEHVGGHDPGQHRQEAVALGPGGEHGVVSEVRIVLDLDLAGALVAFEHGPAAAAAGAQAIGGHGAADAIGGDEDSTSNTPDWL